MNADNHDFKLNFGTKPEVKRKAFIGYFEEIFFCVNLRKSAS